jgi:hypothetical protein
MDRGNGVADLIRNKAIIIEKALCDQRSKKKIKKDADLFGDLKIITTFASS